MDEHATHASSIKPWRRGGAASVHASTPLVIDVFVDARMRDVDVADDATAAEAVSRTLVERWVLSHDARCRGDGEEEEVVVEEEEEQEEEEEGVQGVSEGVFELRRCLWGGEG